MNTSTPSTPLAALRKEQTRLRLSLAAILLLAVCAFALTLSWLGQDDPLQPLLRVKVSLIALLCVYAVGIGVAWLYARWIRARREPIVREFVAKNNK